jgi:hypothetical protein
VTVSVRLNWDQLRLEAIVVEARIECERLSPKFPPSFPHIRSLGAVIALCLAGGSFIYVPPRVMVIESMSLVVNGFVNDLVNQFPMEYSIELKRSIDLEIEGSVG